MSSIDKKTDNSSLTKFRVVVAAAVFAVVGIFLLSYILAAPGFFSVYTDSLKLSGPVNKCEGDSLAGGQNYVLFGSNCEGGGTAGWPTPTKISKVSIATLGDSNTASGFWRKPFQQALNAEKCEYDMIGLVATNWGNIDFSGLDRDTDGSSGAVIATYRNPNNAIFEKGRSTLTSKAANIVLVVGGTNDVKSLSLNNSSHVATLTKTVSETKKHIIEAASLSPESYFYVVAIGQIRGNEATVTEYNSRLKQAVSELQSQVKVRFIDVATTSADMGADGIHFSVEGGQKYGGEIAAQSVGLIRQFGVCEADETASSGESGSNTGGGDCITAAGHVDPRVGECVGVSAGTSLQNYSSNMSETSIVTISTDGAVIENKRIIGCVDIRAKNVTFRNNYVECYRSRDINGNGRSYLGNGPVTVQSSSTGAKVERNTLVCKMKNSDTAACDYGVFLGAGAARFNDVSGVVDGFDPRGNTVIEYNYVHDFGVAYEEWREREIPEESSHYSHADGVQMYAAGSGNISIKGNYFKGATDAQAQKPEYQGLQAVLVQAASSSSPKPDIRIENNAVIGNWKSLRLSCVSNAACAVEGNTVDARYKSSQWVIDFRGTNGSSFAKCNRFTDGSLIQSVNVQQGTAITSGC